MLRADAEGEAINAVDGLFAFKIGIVIPELVSRHDEGLDIADIVEVFLREDQVFQA